MSYIATDQNAAKSITAAKYRIRDIYSNRGLPIPDDAKLTAMANNVVTQGYQYFDTIRADPSRYLPSGTTASSSGMTPQQAIAAINQIYGGGTAPTGDKLRLMAEKVMANPAYIETIRRNPQNYIGDLGTVNRGVAPGTSSGTSSVGPITADTPVDTGPKRDFLGEARGLYPWLTGQLLTEFAGFYSESGSATAALGRLRQTSTYDRVFDGIKREDGSLRLNEAEYFSDKAGFTETLREFGLNPARYESKFADLIRKDVRAQEFMQAAASGYQRFVEPGANDTGLFGKFLDAFIGSGAEEVALREVRGSAEYDKVFVENRRADGTLRMDEPEFFAYKRGWYRTLAGFCQNPAEYEARGRFAASVRGELSIQEVGGRLQSVQDGILDRADEIKEFYARGYGIQLTNEAILGMAIDPTIQRDVLERRITAGQIGGEAARQGFMRSVGRAEELARAGINQESARGLYGQAAQQLGGLSATTTRFNRGGTSLDQFEGAIGLGDARQMGRLQGALREEQSQFTGRGDTRRSQDGFGLSGLRQR